MKQEEINSYLITKVKQLEGDLEALSGVLHTLIDSLPDPELEDAAAAADMVQQLAASRAVMDEKRRLGQLLWTGGR